MRSYRVRPRPPSGVGPRSRVTVGGPKQGVTVITRPRPVRPSSARVRRLAALAPPPVIKRVRSERQVREREPGLTERAAGGPRAPMKGPPMARRPSDPPLPGRRVEALGRPRHPRRRIGAVAVRPLGVKPRNLGRPPPDRAVGATLATAQRARIGPRPARRVGEVPPEIFYRSWS